MFYSKIILPTIYYKNNQITSGFYILSRMYSDMSSLFNIDHDGNERIVGNLRGVHSVNEGIFNNNLSQNYQRPAVQRPMMIGIYYKFIKRNLHVLARLTIVQHSKMRLKFKSKIII